MKLPFLFLKVCNAAAFLFICLAVMACSLTAAEEDEEPKPTDGVSESLHFNFKTPDWERKIDCTHLNLPSNSLSEDVYYTFATSQSTNSTFFLSYPADSSQMVKEGHLKKYGIAAYGMNDSAFQLSLKLPAADGSSDRLVSKEGQSETSYNEIVGISYEGHEGGEAIFKIKARYQMKTTLIGEEGIEKQVSGTYHFKIRTSSK